MALPNIQSQDCKDVSLMISEIFRAFSITNPLKLGLFGILSLNNPKHTFFLGY